MNEIRIPFKTMAEEFLRILLEQGFNRDNAEICAGIFAQNSLEGIYSHGIYRFPRFIEYIQKGYIDLLAKPIRIHSAGAIEQWDGQLGPGPLNAVFCTNRAVELARANGLGCVALANTNHWMRGGTYGWQAVRQRCAFIGWTNTEANLPAWGAREARLGNNPMVLAVPFEDEAIIIDFAMSQFSYGKMEKAHLEGALLSCPGGFSKDGALTSIPGEILASRRALPVGYWKGAGLSLLLDILAAILSGGLASCQISKKEAEHSVSQIFIAFDLQKLQNFSTIESTIAEIIRDIKSSAPDETGSEIRYPGERTVQIRRENSKNGIPVNQSVWNQILQL